MYLYVERIRDFFGLCAIEIYFLLTFFSLLTYFVFVLSLLPSPGHAMNTSLHFAAFGVKAYQSINQSINQLIFIVA